MAEKKERVIDTQTEIERLNQLFGTLNRTELSAFIVALLQLIPSSEIDVWGQFIVVFVSVFCGLLAHFGQDWTQEQIKILDKISHRNQETHLNW